MLPLEHSDPYQPPGAPATPRAWSAPDAAAGGKWLVASLAASVVVPNVWMFVWVLVFASRGIETARAGFPWASGFGLLFACLAVPGARRFGQALPDTRRMISMVAVVTHAVGGLASLIVRALKAQDQVLGWLPLMRDAADTFVIVALCASATAFRGVHGVVAGASWGALLIVLSLLLDVVSPDSTRLSMVVGFGHAAFYCAAWIFCLRCILLVCRHLLRPSAHPARITPQNPT